MQEVKGGHFTTTTNVAPNEHFSTERQFVKDFNHLECSAYDRRSSSHLSLFFVYCVCAVQLSGYTQIGHRPLGKMESYIM